MLFQKLRQGLGIPLFTKQNAKTHSDLFRKGYNTLQKVAGGVDVIGNYARGLTPSASKVNPILGGITSSIGGLSPLISKTLNDVVSNAKSVKKSIERAKPQKESSSSKYF